MIICECNPSNPQSLWLEFRQQMSYDTLRNVREMIRNDRFDFTDQIYNSALILLEDHCIITHGIRSLQDVGITPPDRRQDRTLNREILRERQYDTDALRAHLQDAVPRMNAEQKMAFDTIIAAIRSNSGGLFSIDAPGDTGKTFLLNLILATVR